MPPRANRQPKRAENATSNPSGKKLAFDRVHLPRLQDTPGSRRQYSYGAAVEPPASRRFTGDYADAPYTLDNAIKHGLEVQARELEEERNNFGRSAASKSPAPASKPRTRKATREGDAEDDELASAAFPPPQKNAPAAPSEADDARSFGVESDVYGDATIASTPDVAASLIHQRPEERSVNRRDTRRRAKTSQDPAYRDSGSDQSSDDELGARRTRRRMRPSAKAAEQHQTELRQQEERQATRSSNTANLQKATSGTSARRPEALVPDQRQSPRSLARYTQVQQVEQEKRDEIRRQQELLQQKEIAERKHLEERKQPSEQEEISRMAQQKKDSTKATQRRIAADDSSSDRSEQDAALQDDIQAREDALSSERSNEDERQRWQQRWDYLQSMSPTKFLQRYRQVPAAQEDEHESEDDEEEELGANNWHRLFSPHQYWAAISGLFTWIAQTAATAWKAVVRYVPSLFGAAAVLTVAVLLLAAVPSLKQLGQSSDLFEDSEHSRFSISGPLRSMSNGLGSILPAITRPFRHNWDDILDLTDFDTNGKMQMEDFLRRYGEQFEHFKNAGLLQSESIRKLEAILPKVVHMRMENGRPVVAPEFWHAVRELIQDDERIFTFQDDGQPSKKQWKLVSSKLLNDDGLEKKLSASVGGAEHRMDQKMSSLWDSWVKENDDKLQEVLGESIEKVRQAGPDKELDSRIARIIKDHVKSDGPKDDLFVTRDEFLRHLRNEFATHRAEVKAELNELRPNVEQLVHNTIQKLGLNVDKGNGLDEAARAEVTTLVNQAISTALTNANIEALTRSEIHSHWDTTLKNQINYFSIGSGATINAEHSSTSYDPYGEGVFDRRKLSNGIRAARRWQISEALMPWSEDGDKWCAARDLNKEGKPYGYMLAVQLARPVIPQQIVIEHVLPGATIDPDARPREIEIYAQIEDPELRERVLDFSATHVVQRSHEVVAPLEADMVRIARFTYAGAELHDGVHVEQLSRELLQLGAETTEIVVRAVNNYGAADHTCFYRVRMYGQSSDEEVVVRRAQEEEPSLWKWLSGE